MMNMTKEEFFYGYCRRSGISEEWAREHGFEAVPCDCGEDGCMGWQMKTQPDALSKLLGGKQ